MDDDEFTAAKLMGSEVIRVSVTDGDDSRDSDLGSSFSSSKFDRGFSNSCESLSWIKKADVDSSRRSSFLSRLTTETNDGVPLGMCHGIDSSSMASMSASDMRQMQRKVVKVTKNGNVSLKKLQMIQTQVSLPQFEANDTKMELDKLGMPLLKCSNTDKSATVKQKSNVNGRRGDRRNNKVQTKGRFDPFSLKPGLSSSSPSSGGTNNTFGMYGLKPDIHDITNLIEDISLNELLDGSYKNSTLVKHKGNKASQVTENILDSVMKACSVLRLSGLQQGKQSEEVDVNDKCKTSSLVSSPSTIGVVDNSDGDDDGSLTVCLSKFSEDQESCIKTEVPAFEPKHMLERLSLPQLKDLDSLLHDASKLTTSVKFTESRYAKHLSHCFTLPPFTWSCNFNGHYKYNNDAMRNTNKSTCQGRWVKIRNGATLIGSGGNEGCLDFELLTYDDSLVPAGQGKYRVYEGEKILSTSVSRECSTCTVPSHASHPPTILTAAQTLCDIARHWAKHNGIMRWSKPSSQKSTKARKSRPGQKSDGEFITPTSENLHDNLSRSVDCGSFKKPKISMVERREASYHQTVVALSSVSAPRSSRSSPIKLMNDSVAEIRRCNKSFTKPTFMLPPPRRVVDRSNNNHPQKLRKLGPNDWNKTRS